MSSADFKDEISEDSKCFGKVIHAEYSMFKRHLVYDHDRSDIYQFAYRKGIIQDPIRYHNLSYVIQQIAEISRVKRE